MKTLTELSGTLVRKAAAAIAEARRRLPAPEPTAAPEAADVAAAVAPEAGAAAPEAAAAAPEAGAAAPEAAVAAPEAGAAAPEVAAPAAAPRRGAPAVEVETEEVKAAFDAAVAEATGLSGDRLAHLRGAVKAAGKKVDDVRLVRVFGPEEPISGATTLNGFQYLVDHAPASMRQEWSPKKKDRGGRGGDRGRAGPGGGGGKGAPASGGFSMDSLRDDRKGSRGGPSGRGKPGGGSPR